MLKQAYEHGVLLALREEGLIKEAGATHGAKELASQAWAGAKRYFTGAGVREALTGVAKAKQGIQAAPDAMGIARKKVLKSLVPYLAPTGIAGAAAATPAAMGALYPDF